MERGIDNTGKICAEISVFNIISTLVFSVNCPDFPTILESFLRIPPTLLRLVSFRSSRILTCKSESDYANRNGRLVLVEVL